MAYTQDRFGMWYDSADQASNANSAFADNFNHTPQSVASTANELTSNGSGQQYAGPNYGGGGAASSPPSGGGMGGMSTAGASSAGQNPYLAQMGNVMTQQMTDNFNTRVAPQISSAAMAAGGYGGSRQGVMEANAMNDLQKNIGNGLTNLYGNGFNTALNYDLGLRGNDLGFAGLDAQINQNNFNNNLAGAQFGQGVWNQNMANNQTGINSGTSIQNTPMNYWSQFGNQYNSIGNGYGSTTESASQQGNPVMSALGGAQLGSQVGNMFGGSANAAGGSNSQGWGTGSGYGNQDYGSYF